MNWQELYSFASKQALLGLCFEDIERLGEEYPGNLPSIVFTTLSVPLVGDRNPCGRVLNPLPSPRPFQKGKGCNRPPVLRTATL